MKDEVSRWVEKVKNIKTEADLSRDEDLAIGIMNLISIEEHLFFTAQKTNNQQYLEMLSSVRGLRTKLMKKIVKNPKGEEWCISKHLLAASMRLVEVGTKEYNADKKEAASYFNAAFELFSLFFAINLQLADVEEIKNNRDAENGSLSSKFSEVIKKIVDCCKEW
ncbi:hypothetical protein HYV80_06150 [Candidatus Woesearchaeota archaeon]|nr:hypothetical protein [Candidatus Woesearchaeota archaeon]